MHHRVLGHGLQALLKMRRDLLHMAHQIALLVDLQGLDRHRCTHRVPRIGHAMREQAIAGAALCQAGINLGTDQRGRNRQVRA